MNLRDLQERQQFVRKKFKAVGASHQGFTLVEVMVVTALLALLTLYAWPAWNDSIKKAHVAMARIDMKSAAVALEKWKVIHGTYEGFSFSAAGITGVASSRYDLYVSGLDVSSYRITAVAKSLQKGYECLSSGTGAVADELILDETGWKSPIACWKKS